MIWRVLVTLRCISWEECFLGKVLKPITKKINMKESKKKNWPLPLKSFAKATQLSSPSIWARQGISASMNALITPQCEQCSKNSSKGTATSMIINTIGWSWRRRRSEWKKKRTKMRKKMIEEEWSESSLYIYIQFSKRGKISNKKKQDEFLLGGKK